ncbi:MAG TPA: hypothetical protein IAC63_01705 [Candidatus Enterousia avicola]|uniref:Uncharacterized protein n=1 Tax=Candidatus Enterousia avicola TaxID=2840787 RepID=A0A9D1MRJ7_9PROT|nr:hypothetical protein [Candidatus Enterousia avicola]
MLEKKATNTNNIPKSYLKFKALLPRDGFCILKPDDFKKMIKIIHDEQDKKTKNVLFGEVLDKLFAGGWGWYMRYGQSLSSARPIRRAYQLPESERDKALKVLRMVKDMHIELRYKPSYIGIINSFIREFGGKTVSREQQNQKQKEEFNKAISKIKSGSKMPRKLKKRLTKLEKVH